jgi:tryptophan synthase beta subunit
MRRRRRKPDPLARAAVLGIAGGRIAIGVGAVLATRPALKILGFEASDTSARALTRIAGGRDIALGLLTVAARDDRARLRETAAVAAGLDLGDAIAFGIAGRDPAAGRAAVQGILSGGAAALVGAWAVRRLG